MVEAGEMAEGCVNPEGQAPGLKLLRWLPFGPVGDVVFPLARPDLGLGHSLAAHRDARLDYRVGVPRDQRVPPGEPPAFGKSVHRL